MANMGLKPSLSQRQSLSDPERKPTEEDEFMSKHVSISPTKPPTDSPYVNWLRPTHIVLTAAMRKVRWHFLPQTLTSSCT
jgi:hypothetical protein